MRRPSAFEWDEVKAAANAAKHFRSFSVAVRIFDDPDCLVRDASRTIDGESGQKAIGMIDGRPFTRVCTRRGEIVRVISARRSNPSEERVYGDRTVES